MCGHGKHHKIFRTRILRSGVLGAIERLHHMTSNIEIIIHSTNEEGGIRLWYVPQLVPQVCPSSFCCCIFCCFLLLLNFNWLFCFVAKRRVSLVWLNWLRRHCTTVYCSIISFLLFFRFTHTTRGLPKSHNVNEYVCRKEHFFPRDTRSRWWCSLFAVQYWAPANFSFRSQAVFQFYNFRLSPRKFGTMFGFNPNPIGAVAGNAPNQIIIKYGKLVLQQPLVLGTHNDSMIFTFPI